MIDEKSSIIEKNNSAPSIVEGQLYNVCNPFFFTYLNQSPWIFVDFKVVHVKKNGLQTPYYCPSTILGALLLSKKIKNIFEVNFCLCVLVHCFCLIRCFPIILLFRCHSIRILNFDETTPTAHQQSRVGQQTTDNTTERRYTEH